MATDDADLDTAAGDAHLLADGDDRGGHLDLLGVQRDTGEGAAAVDVVRQALQVAQRRRRARPGLVVDSCPGRQTGSPVTGTGTCASAAAVPTDRVNVVTTATEITTNRARRRVDDDRSRSPRTCGGA